MRAAIFDEFKGPITVREVPDPVPPADGVVIRVMATGVCRSDWHGWMGHDRDVRVPHVPGHELAGVVESVGAEVRRWTVDERVTVPFSVGCGRCAQCVEGFSNTCDDYFQPGFTAWGSFAEKVAIRYADANLVALPDTLDFVAAASLGCRFATSYRGVVAQGRVAGGEWVAIHGCGGVGLSAILIATALGAHVAAVDVNPSALELARSAGAAITINANEQDDVPAAIRDATDGGAHTSIDALGSEVTCSNSILSLRKRGRHVQIGLLDEASLPMARVIAYEIELVGSHGLQASVYPEMLALIASHRIDPALLVRKTITLDEAGDAITEMGNTRAAGVTVIDRF